MDTPASVRNLQFKEALSATVEGARLPRKAIADLIGVAQQTLSAWCDTHVDAHIPSCRLPALLVNAREDHSLVQYLAGLQGATVVTLPAAGTEGAGVAQLAELAQAFAALLDQHARASRDGRWTADEVDLLRPVATELAARAMAHLACAERDAKVSPLAAHGARRSA